MRSKAMDNYIHIEWYFIQKTFEFLLADIIYLHMTDLGL